MSSPPLSPEALEAAAVAADNLAPEEPITNTMPSPAQPTTKSLNYPPYPDYPSEPKPVPIMDMITGGKTIRYKYKSFPPQPARPPPRPAMPKGPKVTDVRMSRREYLAHARCLRRHGAVLTERLERMARPPRRRIIHMWRDKADVLPAETIARFRTMLDADEPFKPEQAYEYFMNLKKSKKKPKPSGRSSGLKAKKQKTMDIASDKRCGWARNATIAFARGIQKKLGKPGCYNLQDGMLNLSNVVMCEISKFMHMKPVHRHCAHPKSQFLMELSDKIAVWIDELMLESDERMLMMDVDEDDEVEKFIASASERKAKEKEASVVLQEPPDNQGREGDAPPMDSPSHSPERSPSQKAAQPQSPPATSPPPKSPPPNSPPPKSPPPNSPPPQSPPPNSPPPKSPPPNSPPPTSPPPKTSPPGPTA